MIGKGEKNNANKKNYILPMFQNIIQTLKKKKGEGWHYLAVKKLKTISVINRNNFET